MNRLTACALTLLLTAAALPAELVPTPTEVLAASIARHDPEGAWETGAFRMVVGETRPDGTVRETRLLIDNRAGRFETSSTRDGDLVEGRLGPELCVWSVNGSTEFSEATRERHRLTCERLERLRNYYVYLWGLPMKLRDPGTRLRNYVAPKEFEGRPALELRVSYDEDVGSDVWYFYFELGSNDLIGYRFYHDEAANDGEYITLEGVLQEAGLRLPKTRAWYTHKEDEYLGTDTLISIEAARPGG